MEIDVERYQSKAAIQLFHPAHKHYLNQLTEYNRWRVYQREGDAAQFSQSHKVCSCSRSKSRSKRDQGFGLFLEMCLMATALTTFQRGSFPVQD